MVRTRKPTKKRRVSSSHTQQQERDFDLEFFDSFAHSEQWIVFKDRPIVWGRRVDLSAKYDHLLRYYIQRMDWEGLFDIPLVAYPQLIKLFYSNLRIVDDPTHGYYLMSYVKGIEMILSVSALAQILHIPSGSEQIYFSGNLALQTVINQNEFYELLTGDSGFRGTLAAKQLHPNIKLLNRYISENVVQTGGHHDEVTPFQSYFLYIILKNGSVSLPYLMLREMADASTNPKRSLPYGGLLTKVFLQFSVCLENEPEHRLKTPFTKTTITKMKLTHIETLTIPMEDAQVQGEDANAPGEQGDNSTHGSNFQSASDIYTRLLHLEEQQCNLVQQFIAFRESV